MPDVREIAVEASRWFETATRGDDGATFVRVKDGAPDWVTDLVHEAHGEMLPDDWRYQLAADAAEAIADGTDDPGEFADGHVDVYTFDRFAWLSSHLARQGYVDTAAEEFGLPADGDFSVVDAIGRGQYVEAGEVFGLVLAFLERRADE